MTSQITPVSSANPQPAACPQLRPEPSPSSGESLVDGGPFRHTRDFDVESVDYELSDQWNDTGGNWWQGSRAPSYRIDGRGSGLPHGGCAPGNDSA